MNEYATLTKPATIVMKRLLPGPIERVWAYLTESDKRSTWLAAGGMDLHVGGAVFLTFNHACLSPVPETVPKKYKDICDSGATLKGVITQINPPYLLAYTWGEQDGSESEVSFELKPLEDKVQLTLTHEKLFDHDTLIGVSAGWHTHIGIMIDRLEGKTPKPFWSSHIPLEAEYKKRLSKT